MTNYQAREYFKNKGLSYGNITKEKINILSEILSKNIKVALKNKEIDIMRMSKKIKGKYDADEKLIECYLFVNSDYYTRRECISFNKDGFIGFAGWACSGNTAPIIKSFIEWCDCLVKGDKK